MLCPSDDDDEEFEELRRGALLGVLGDLRKRQGKRVRKRASQDPLVYKLTNMINGKGYVGKTVDSTRRMLEHRKGHPGKNGKVQYVDRAIQKHGWANFKVEWLEINVPEDQLLEREGFHMRKHNTMVPNGYNILKPGVETVSMQDPWVRAWWELRNPEGTKRAVATLTAKREEKLASMNKEDAATLSRRLEMGRAREKRRHGGEEMLPDARWSEETNSKKAAIWKERREAKAALMSPEQAAKYMRTYELSKKSRMKCRERIREAKRGEGYVAYQKVYRKQNRHKWLALNRA